MTGHKTALAGAALILVLMATGAGASKNLLGEHPVFVPDTPSLVQPGEIQLAQLGSIQATPYRWSAEKSEDGTIVINGYAPDAATQARLLAAAGPRALDASSTARGEPEGFSDNALTALTILLALDEGAVAFSNSGWQITGNTGKAVAWKYVERLIGDADLAGAGWQLDIEMNALDAVESQAAVENDSVAETEDAATAPSGEDEAETPPEPDVAAEPMETSQPFGFAVRTIGEDWLVGGNSPSAAFQRYIELHFGVATRGELAVAEAPEGFAAAALAGMEALRTLESGALLFDEGRWTLNGIAADTDLAKTVTASLESLGIGADIAVAEAEPMLEPPVEEPEMAEPAGEEPSPVAAQSYGFAVRTLGEDWLVGGNAPSAAFQRYIELHFGKVTRGELAVAVAPEGFAASALAGMEALATLQSGQLLFDGSAWRLSGFAGDDAAAKAAETVLADAGIAAEIGIAEPAPPVVVAAPEPVIPPLPLPTANPYRWVAEKPVGGSLSISGYVPAESVEKFLGVRAGDTGSLDVALASGAPEGFAADMIAGLDALAALESGRLALGANGWSLSGKALDESASSSVLAALGPRAKTWTMDIDVPPPPPPPVDKGAPDYMFSAFKPADGQIILAGDVPAEATRAFLGMLAGEGSADGLMVRDGAPQNFVAGATAAVRALASLDSGRFDYRDFAWSFAGESAYEATRDAARDSLVALSGPPAWTIDITGPTPLELCTAEVTAFDERNAILFDAGSARITRDSLPALAEIADVLKACPRATVQVEGHTDADGDEESNLILSVARAEAVVDRLIELGIGEARLYAIGYGESLPIASNETRDGKRRNRRIVLTVSKEP